MPAGAEGLRSIHVSAPYVATGLINVLYTCSLAALDINLLLSILRFVYSELYAYND
jgi:hypothetical protein